MKILSLNLILFFTGLATNGQSNTSADYHLLIGTYSTDTNPNGIHVYRFNTLTADFEMVRPVTELHNASFLAVSSDRKNVYAVSESSNGSINAYRFDPVTGKLSFMNKVQAAGPCYVSVDENKQAVFSGNYGGGSVQAIHLHADGSLITEGFQTIQHKGSSIVKGRQDKPHVHAAVLSLDNRYLLVPDLGTDKVCHYRIDFSSSDILKTGGTPLEAPPGTGPRHFTFHPNGEFAYLVLELEASVAALKYRQNNGSLELFQVLSMTGDEFQGRVSGADLHISPDGKFLYASNRGDANEIAVYSIDSDGTLSLVSRQSVLGETPRNFAIDPSGNFLLAANQNSNQIVIFGRDATTGEIRATGKTIQVDRPVCLIFAKIGS